MMVLMWLLLLISALDDDDGELLSLFALDARKIGNDCTADSKFDIDEPKNTQNLWFIYYVCAITDCVLQIL